MAEELCKNNRGHKGCQNIVLEGGVENSGYCEDCYYPGIVEENENYAGLLESGHTPQQAAAISGLDDHPVQLVYGASDTEPDTPTIASLNQSLDHEFDAAAAPDENAPHHHLGTAPITSVVQQRDAEDDDEAEAEDELTNQILDRIECKNNQPELPGD